MQTFKTITSKTHVIKVGHISSCNTMVCPKYIIIIIFIGAYFEYIIITCRKNESISPKISNYFSNLDIFRKGKKLTKLNK